MSEREKLTLHCAELSCDTLNVRAGTAQRASNPLPVVYVYIDETDSRCSASLDETSARALFNWLGVWLATPK